MFISAIVRAGVVTLALVGTLARPAAAQSAMPEPNTGRPSGPAEPRFLFGPVGVTPALAITEIGVDSNVLNAETGEESDFTTTITPSASAVMRSGLARLTGSASFGFVYYAEFADQRSVNQNYEGGVDFELSRFRPWVSFAYARTRTRPGFEIDLRARRTEPRISVGSEIRLSGRTWFDVAYRRADYKFEEGETFQGADLQETLNRETEAYFGAMRFAATPLTTVVLMGDFERIRFEFDPLRDGDSARLMTGVEFNPDALIRGRAYVGFRQFKALGPGVPDYTGPVAAAEISSTLFGNTRLDGRVTRDVMFSYEQLTPYYVVTGAGLVFTQRLVGPFDLRATGSRDRLAYRAVERTDPEPIGTDLELIGLDPLSNIDRTDVVYSFGGGVGYHLGETGRIGANVEYTERSSSAELAHPYNRLRVFASFNYEF